MSERLPTSAQAAFPTLRQSRKPCLGNDATDRWQVSRYPHRPGYTSPHGDLLSRLFYIVSSWQLKLITIPSDHLLGYFLLLIIVSGIWIVQSARWSQEAVKSRQGTHSYWARGHWDSALDNTRHGDTATISDRTRLACSWETINDFRSMTSPNTCSSITSD